MSSSISDRLKLAMVLLISAFMLIPQGLSVGEPTSGEQDEDIYEADTTQDGILEKGSRELSEEEVKELGLTPPEIPTRSEPFYEWERFHYHRGRESGFIAFREPDRLYIFGGGYDSWSSRNNRWSHSSYEDLFYYNMTTTRWTAIEYTSGPGGRHGFSWAVDEDNGVVYLYGGFDMGTMRDDLWKFDMYSHTWTALASSQVLEPSYPRRAYAPMVYDPTEGDEGVLYLHSGWEDDMRANPPKNESGFLKIDLSSPSGTPQNLNDGSGEGVRLRYQHDMCIDVANRKIYMFGGRNRVDDYLTELWEYDMTLDSWNFIITPPGMSSMFGAKMYLMTGNDPTINIWGGRNASDSLEENQILWQFHLDTFGWTNESWSEPPDGRLLFHRYFSDVEDKFFVFAGRYYYYSWGRIRSSTYRDLQYLDMTNMEWTEYENNESSWEYDNGIFAYMEDEQRIYYVAPNPYSDSEERVYYWDLEDRNWYGPIYNTGPIDPDRRYNSGMCFDAANKTVYMYGGGWDTGGQTPDYYDLPDLWKIDLTTFEWTQVLASAGPGKRQGFQMVFNENDGKIYFYGGYYHETTNSARTIYDDFFSYDPVAGLFREIEPSGADPEGRHSAGLCMVPDRNEIYLYAGVHDPPDKDPFEDRDLWVYRFSSNTWTKLGVWSGRTDPMIDYDPLLKLLYITGGGLDDMLIYNILEESWDTEDYRPNPGNMQGHAHVFLTDQRDLWVWGGDSKPGIWRIGIPPRLAFQEVYFKDPEESDNVAYAKYRPYTFATSIKMVDARYDMAELIFDFAHRDGSLRIVFNNSADILGEDPWIENDNADVAELVDSSAEWNGLELTVEIQLLFNWTFRHKGSPQDRTLYMKAVGNGVDDDDLTEDDFLKVRNNLRFKGNEVLEAEVQGQIDDKGWVKANETVTVSGPLVIYDGTSDAYPPEDTYELKLWEQGQFVKEIEKVSGEPLNFSIDVIDYTYENREFVINITGGMQDPSETEIVFNISIDAQAPEAPSDVIIHADSNEDARTKYDNDRTVFLTWQGGGDTGSGTKHFYWSFEDGGGTDNGNELNGSSAEIELPSNGTHTIYLWAQDNVGNIGPSQNASITIDEEPISFEILSPDLSGLIPYYSIDLKVNVSDRGGSKVDSYSVKYRFTNDGQNSERWEMWNSISELYTPFHQDFYVFTLSIGKGRIPELSNSDDNFIQFQAMDNGGSTFRSEAFNIRVDTSLRYPDVTLIGPPDGSNFDDPEDIMLNWSLDFFLPEDVVFHLYLSQDRAEVEDTLGSAMVENLTRNFYYPSWVTLGEYYWTVIPIARGKWYGNCLNGVWSFNVTNEKSFSIDVEETDPVVHKYARGQVGIPFEFTIYNTGNYEAIVTPSVDLKGIGTIRWDLLDPQEEAYVLGIGNQRPAPCQLDIAEDAPLGTHEVVFKFTTDFGVVEELVLNITITEAMDESTEKEDQSNMGLYVVIGIIAVVAIMFALAGFYFLVIKKKTKKAASEHDLDRLESDLLEGESKLGMPPAPAATGLRRPSYLEKTKGDLQEAPKTEELPAAGDLTEGEEGEQTPEEELPSSLAEEGSEDDWMNLVAKETKALGSEEEVRRDRLQESSEQPKSLQDILSEMSEGIEDEEP